VTDGCKNPTRLKATTALIAVCRAVRRTNSAIEKTLEVVLGL